MGKISPVASKYIIHSSIDIEGVVDKPDVIGAIFGQTEGLLGSDLELRELQRSGRIGRIEVNVDTRTGKSKGTIIIPSSLDKAETAIVGAALEIIQRIGPCNAKIKVVNIEDVRVSKRAFVIQRAKELLRELINKTQPDSQEITDEVAYSVRIMEVQEYGRERLPAGPAVEESDEILIVEGRADVINLLKYGIKNAIAINGTNVPQTIVELSRKKSVTVFVDGDRGGSLIIKELLTVADIDYITKAPDGKELEELTQKEIQKCLRSRMTVEQYRMETGEDAVKVDLRRQDQPQQNQKPMQQRPQTPQPFNNEQRPPERRFDKRPPQQMPSQRKPFRDERLQPVQNQAPAHKPLEQSEKNTFKKMLEDLIGTRGAYLLDNKLNILGKVPLSELSSTLKSLNTGIYAIVFDGVIDPELVEIAEANDIKQLIGMDTKVNPEDCKVRLSTIADL